MLSGVSHHMKRFFCFFALSGVLLGLAPVSRAQDGNRLKDMQQRLNLTDAQAEQVKAIFEENVSKMKAVKDDASLSDAQKRDQLKELSTARREQLAEILTPEQKAKAGEEMKRQQGGGFRTLDAQQRLEALKGKLGLSEAQVEKLKPILAEEALAMKALKEDSNMLPEAKRETMKQSLERISAELTPEQAEKFKEEVLSRKK